jgi:hypothetical protein
MMEGNQQAASFWLKCYFSNAAEALIISNREQIPKGLQVCFLLERKN